MKKTNRKLIPAVAMLLISAIMLSTSSFAWFSMNSTVTADGMTVKAESNEVFLEIAKTDGAFKTAVTYTDSASDALKPVYPAKGSISGKTLAGANQLGTAETGTFSDIVWITNTSKAAGDAKANENYVKLGDDGAASHLSSTHHAEVYEYAVRLRNNPAENQKLVVTSITVDTAGLKPAQKALLPSLRVMFVTATGYVAYKITGEGAMGDKACGTTAELQDPITVDATADGSDAFQAADKVTVYVYFDGEDSTCFTNNALTSSAYDISFTLGCEAGTPAVSP